MPTHRHTSATTQCAQWWPNRTASRRTHWSVPRVRSGLLVISCACVPQRTSLTLAIPPRAPQSFTTNLGELIALDSVTTMTHIMTVRVSWALRFEFLIASNDATPSDAGRPAGECVCVGDVRERERAYHLARSRCAALGDGDRRARAQSAARVSLRTRRSSDTRVVGARGAHVQTLFRHFTVHCAQNSRRRRSSRRHSQAPNAVLNFFVCTPPRTA
jgi:hypothetical protein